MKFDHRKRVIITVIAAIFMFSSLAGAVILFSNSMSSVHGECPFMQHAQTMCNMGPVDHVVHWQQLFMSLPVDFISLILLTSMILGMGIFFLWKYLLPPPIFKNNFHIQREFDLRPFNYFIDLFSQGILHTRLYA